MTTLTTHQHAQTCQVDWDDPATGKHVLCGRPKHQALVLTVASTTRAEVEPFIVCAQHAKEWRNGEMFRAMRRWIEHDESGS